MSLRAYRHINRLDGPRPGLLPGILAAFICGLATVAVAEEPSGAEDQAPTPAEMPAANPVEAPDLPASGQSEPEPTETVAEKQRRLAQERFLRLFDEKSYADAREAAAEVAELTRRQFGEDSIKLVSPLNNLATAQMMNGEILAAEENYKYSIALLERHEGILSGRLINPLIGLGASYNRAGMYEQAAKSFERALHINHVNDGFYNFDQFKIRDGLTESHIGLQDLDAANFQQETQLEIGQRKLGENNIDLAPLMYKLARWYQRSGQAETARLTYRSAQRLLRESNAANSDAMVDAMLGIADTYESQGLISESASNLKRAIEILDEQDPVNRVRRAEILVELGDLYTVAGKYDSAADRYQAAWQDLSAEDGSLDRRDALFEEPVRIRGISWSTAQYAGRDGPDTPEEDLADGYVLIKYSLDNRGRVDDAVLIEGSPPGMMDERAMKILTRSYFRPRMKDGQTVAATGLIHRHDFQYRAVSAASADTSTAAEEPDTAAADDDDPGGRSSTGGRLERPTMPDY